MNKDTLEMKQEINRDHKYVAAIDLGSYQIRLSIADIYKDDVQIIYYKSTPAKGITYGSIFNPKQASETIEKLINDAEKELNIGIEKVVCCYPKHGLSEHKTRATLTRDNSETPITYEELHELKQLALEKYQENDNEEIANNQQDRSSTSNNAEETNVDSNSPQNETKNEAKDKLITKNLNRSAKHRLKNQTIFACVSQSFSTENLFLSNEENIIGIPSDVIEGCFNFYTGEKRKSSNIDMTFKNLGISVEKKFFTPETLGSLVLKPEEKNNGVALVDMGGGATSVAIFANGILRHFASIPFGGNNITRDINLESNISFELADNIKKAYGSCMPEKLYDNADKSIEIVDFNPKVRISIKFLSEIVSTRLKEIIEAILYEIQQSGYADQLLSGVVITGGGANLTNCCNYFKELSGYNVRKGYPITKFSCNRACGIFETDAAILMSMILASKNTVDNCCAYVDEKPAVEKVVAESKKSNDIQNPETIKRAENETLRHQSKTINDVARKQTNLNNAHEQHNVNAHSENQNVHNYKSNVQVENMHTQKANLNARTEHNNETHSKEENKKGGLNFFHRLFNSVTKDNHNDNDEERERV